MINGIHMVPFKWGTELKVLYNSLNKLNLNCHVWGSVKYYWQEIKLIKSGKDKDAASEENIHLLWSSIAVMFKKAKTANFPISVMACIREKHGSH